MITITNGKMTLEVTPGAYKDIFRAQGFEEILWTSNLSVKNDTGDAEVSGGIISRSAPEPSSTNVFTEENETSINELEKPETEKERLEEIPLSEMTPEQLKEYAKILGVDIRGLKSKSAVKDKIRSVL